MLIVGLSEFGDDGVQLRMLRSFHLEYRIGLKECRKCVLILSPNFLSNEGWTKAEFDSVFTREILEAADVIIPVWHGVEKQDVYNYSPRLLDKVGIPSTLGTEEVARRILRAINHVLTIIPAS